MINSLNRSNIIINNNTEKECAVMQGNLSFMLVFAQHHFVIALLITLTVAGGEIALFRMLRKDEQNHKFSRKRHRRYQFAFRRCSVLSTAVVCVIPCLFSIFIYGVESPTYKATEELWNQLFSETEAVVEADKPANPYEKKLNCGVTLKRKTGVSCLYRRE